MQNNELNWKPTPELCNSSSNMGPRLAVVDPANPSVKASISKIPFEYWLDLQGNVVQLLVKNNRHPNQSSEHPYTYQIKEKKRNLGWINWEQGPGHITVEEWHKIRTGEAQKRKEAHEYEMSKMRIESEDKAKEAKFEQRLSSMVRETVSESIKAFMAASKK